jgi:cbb3-type cytochrome oxidase subunit 3
MMPLFTAALRTLTPHQVARGSTLLNITQQIASSVGVALMSVILTAHLNDARSPHEAATSYADTFWVAWVLVVLTLVPAFMLPRKKEESHLLDDEAGEAAPPVVMH